MHHPSQSRPTPSAPARSRVLRPLLAVTMLTALFLGTTPTSAQERGLLSAKTRSTIEQSLKVGPQLVAALDNAERAPVMILFEVPGLAALQARGLTGPDLDGAREAVERATDEVLHFLPDREFNLSHRYHTVSGVAGEITAEGLLAVLQHPLVVRVDLDTGGQASIVESRALTNTDSVLGQGYTGSGVTVAVIDSGVDTDHPDLSGAIVAQQCFCYAGGAGCCPNGAISQSSPGAAEDDNGHGTLVTGVITAKSSGASTSSIKGAAPDSKIVAVKVLDQNGFFSRDADVVQALDWIVDERSDVDVVNMSLGTFNLYTGDCDNATADIHLMAQAINTLRGRDVPVFASAGNLGSGSQMTAPACISNALSVGAVYDADLGFVSFTPSSSFAGCSESTAADKVTCFSNSNAKTDVFAPGGRMRSTWIGGGAASTYGTSFASPMAAACAADLLEARPSLTVSQIEGALESSSIRVTDPTNGRSFPRVECNQALAAAAGTCVPSTTNLCLNNNRFHVSVTWNTGSSTGTGKVVNCSSSDSGLFYFFSANNWEMMVKVLNGCSTNSRYWVFAAGTTTVGWTLTVTDTNTGQVKQYSNPNGQASCAVTDTNAFATCP